MSLSIKNINITDTLTNITTVASIIVTPSDRVPAPAVEIISANDGAKLSVTDLRPNGSFLQINASHNSVPLHSIFYGQVEYVDDDIDPITFTGSIQLSSLPQKSPHRTKISMVWNNTAVDNTSDENLTAHQILREACEAVGVVLGRCDLPDYVVVGTYEAFNRSVVEIAEDLIGPFNTFEYLQHHVQVDDVNGLQIIAVDYSLPDSTIGFNPALVYAVPNGTKVKRSYEMYMPENRIGDNDILLTGGDRLIPRSEDDVNGNGTTIINRRTLTQTFTNTSYNPTTSKEPEQYTTTETTVEFDIEMTNFFTSAPTLEGVAEAYSLAINLDRDLQIIASRTVFEKTFQYESGKLTQTTETYYTYEDMSFRGYEQIGNVIFSRIRQKVLTYSERVSKIFIKAEYPGTMERTYYRYNEFGVQYLTEISKYVYYPDVLTANPNGGDFKNGGWYFNGSETTTASNLDTINAKIKLYSENIKLQRAGLESLQTNSPFDPSSSVGGSGAGDKQQVVQYQTLNGEPFLPEDILNPDRTENKGAYIETDLHANYTEEQIRLRKAFQLNCPYMNFDGLALIYQICLRQVELERRNAYWEDTSITALIDTTVACAGVVKADNSVGIAESVTHSIDSNSATTTVSMKRLIVPNDGEAIVL